MKFPTPFAEKSLTLVAAAFDRRGQAERAAAALRSSPGLAGTVRLVAPCEGGLGRKFEPEQEGIWRTALRSHLLLGVLGLALGLVVTAGLLAVPWPPAEDSPLYTALFSAMMGGFVGLMFAGVLTLRPDHSAVIDAVRPQIEDGAWAVIVRPCDADAARRAFAALRDHGGETYRSF
ncbi:MAG: riboflavin biosynthesis protein RibA [Gammaproteobacteria bacterium]|jgi:hypothetical protein|nr:riboflavin biosynthesis protein RibA [Gammaproteobacteria bacterium]